MPLGQADCTSLYQATTLVSQSPGTTVTITLSRALASNCLGLARIAVFAQGASDPSLQSATMSGVTMAVAEEFHDNGNFYHEYILRCLNASPSGTSFVLTFAANITDHLRASIIEWANVDTGGSNGANAVAQVTGRQTGVAPATISLGVAPAGNNGVCGFYAPNTSPGAVSAGNNYTLKGSDTIDGLGAVAEAGAASAVGTTINFTTVNDPDWIMHGFEIKERGGPGDEGEWPQSARLKQNNDYTVTVWS